MSDDVAKKIDKIMARFDVEHSPRLLAEDRLLSGGSGVVSDAAVPAIYERTMLREALYRLTALQFVDADSAKFASTVEIPYSYRDQTAAGPANTRVYEGAEIPRAGIKQAIDTTYPIPQKLGFEVSDELRHLTGAKLINWDALAENQMNASRIIGEDTNQLLFNAMLGAADEYGAVAITNENLELQADDAKTVFILANFPVVRPRRLLDLQGNQIGSTLYPVTVSYNSTAIEAYDGTGDQAAGTYYVLDYNLGEIYLVDEAGDVQIPADGTAYTISYSYASNTYKFDTDLPVNTDLETHWDSFLYRFALRKSQIEDERFYVADMALMSGSVMTAVEQAKKFGENWKRPGTALAMTGDLGSIKDVPASKVYGPGNHFGDLRVLIGQRGTTRYRMLKPWVLSSLESERGPSGRFTGKKSAYGDQWIAIHTPTPLRAALTTITLYSSSARVAR
ncbi:MAG TPA: hypothetical protein PKZ35_08860 [Gammaproteobacteria bacterium]|nr:hypothetical protein [Gammaproteobacteria bacterium]